MRKLVLLLLAIIPFPALGQISFKSVQAFIQDKSDIREGGCDLFEYKGQQLIVAVAPVAVSTKTEQVCKMVGAAKAKKEMLSFINGSEITSITSLETSESVEETLTGRKVVSRQDYTEIIREKVLGEINKVTPLGGWYSEDKSIYYFAIYKTIE